MQALKSVNYISVYIMRNLLFILFIAIAPVVSAQNNVVLKLSHQAENTPRNFKVTHVADDRANKDNIGEANDKPLQLDGGLEQSFNDYFQNSFKWEQDAVPVEMHIEQLNITENDLGSKKQHDMEIGIAYYKDGNKLMSYTGSAYAQSRGDARPYIDKMIRSNIENNMQSFDQWVGRNKKVLSSGPSVTVHVTIAHSTGDKNLIPYSTSRKLYMTDFLAPPDENSVGSAATQSGIKMNYEGSRLHQQTTIKITIIPYFDKRKSWMKASGKNAHTLEHEQRHFDITALKACELKERIENADITPENYDHVIKGLLKDVQDEAGERQDTYDEETVHGTIIDKQEEWNQRIEKELKAQKCY